MLGGNTDHISATISVSLVNDDYTLHGVCSLATVEEDGPSNIFKTAIAPDFIVEYVFFSVKRFKVMIVIIRFDQLRVKRERCNGGAKGRQKTKPHKQNESVGYLLFQAKITTVNGQFCCQKRSDAIKLSELLICLLLNDNNHLSLPVAAKPESAELHAIKNNYGSVDGGDEVWIRGSKMIGNRESLDKLTVSSFVPFTASVYFEIHDQSSKCIRHFAGVVMREECHQVGLV